MNWNLPKTVNIDGTIYHITNDCDYRMVLDVIETLNDINYEKDERFVVALLQFYVELTRDNIWMCPHVEQLAEKMNDIISAGTKHDTPNPEPPLMDWEHDMPILAPPISRVLGYSVRDPAKYTHWYDFVGAFQEIGECAFATVVSIRSKRLKGKKLEKWELDYFRNNKDTVVLPQKLTKEEEALLNSEW